jgi:hypothetical protein
MTTGQGSRERETEEGQNKKTDGEQTSPRRKRSRQAQVLPAFGPNGISNTCRLVGVDLHFTQRWNMLMLRGQLLAGKNEASVLPVLLRICTQSNDQKRSLRPQILAFFDFVAMVCCQILTDCMDSGKADSSRDDSSIGVSNFCWMQSLGDALVVDWPWPFLTPTRPMEDVPSSACRHIATNVHFYFRTLVCHQVVYDHTDRCMVD